jgi:hypothetical protein
MGQFSVATYEFRARSVQLALGDFFQTGGTLANFLPAQPFAGTFTTSGTSMQFNVDYCGTLNLSVQVGSVQYTATANGLQTIAQAGVGTVVISYARQ